VNPVWAEPETGEAGAKDIESLQLWVIYEAESKQKLSSAVY
jgi:hypothetical protein